MIFNTKSPQEEHSIHEAAKYIQEPVVLIGMACRLPGDSNFRMPSKNSLRGVGLLEMRLLYHASIFRRIMTGPRSPRQ